jgi:tetratricopeptide (TPR) repeat protein
MAGELWPPLASLDYHRQRLDETLEAYPRDMVATLSRLLLELVNAPSERGRPQLRRYVDAHADDPTRMRDLVYALDSHELEVEIATTVLPRVEPDDLPATTNRTLFASAVHANRPEQANALADLLLERLPDTAYVASDLAREALDHGHDELASRLLARAKAAGSIPYTRLVEARIELGAHASAAGVDIANELLDRHELAPSDHCPLFVDALDAGETVLARRLVRSMVMLPTRNRGRVASWMIRRTSDCLIGAGKAAPGLRLLVAEFPRIADGARSSLDPYMAIEMARLYREAGRPDVASDLLESANTSLKLFQQRRAPARLWRERAKTAIALGALDDALRFARTSMHTGSPTEIAEGLAVLAEVHAARGDYATATAYLRVAYARHPKLERRNQIRLRLLTVRRAGDDHFLSQNDASVTLTTKRP